MSAMSGVDHQDEACVDRQAEGHDGEVDVLQLRSYSSEATARTLESASRRRPADGTDRAGPAPTQDWSPAVGRRTPGKRYRRLQPKSRGRCADPRWRASTKPAGPGRPRRRYRPPGPHGVSRRGGHSNPGHDSNRERWEVTAGTASVPPSPITSGSRAPLRSCRGPMFH